MKAAIAAAVQKAPKGTFIYGEIAWKIFRDPSVNRDTLDQVAPNNPVILQTLTNHAWIMNSAALARKGIRCKERGANRYWTHVSKNGADSPKQNYWPIPKFYSGYRSMEK